MVLPFFWPLAAGLLGFLGGFFSAGGFANVVRLALVALAVLAYMEFK